MPDDAELLQRYAAVRTGDDFAEIVRRHVDFVYSAALRQVNGDAHLAEDVVQLVFADLARKAGQLARHRVLAGWLFTSTRFAAAKAVRGEQRRRAREREAYTMEELDRDPAAQLDWGRVRPVLDAALADLNERDRTAILLRFFEGRGFAEVGERLELSENSARMRVERALDKLHGLLARRGVTSTTGALAAAMAGQAVTAAPVGLAASVTGVALAGAAAGSGAVAAMTFMSMTKLQLGLAGAVALTGVAGIVSQQRAAEAVRKELAALPADEGREVATLRVGNERLAQAAAAAARRRGVESELTELRENVATLARRVDAQAAAARAEIAAAREARARATTRRVNAALQRAAEHPGLDLMPRRTLVVPPVYPADMQAAGVTGEVVVSFVVGADGEVHEAQAVQSTRPEFEAAAEEGLLRWEFEPGVKGQRVVNTRMEQKIAFSLPDGAAPAGGLQAVDHSAGAWLQ